MQFTLVGWSHYGFTNDKGQYVEGYKFHIVRQSAARDFHGHEACSMSVSEQTVQHCGDPIVGGVYNVTYDQKGRIAGYKCVQDPSQTRIKGA